jgi:hypothetical protein
MNYATYAALTNYATPAAALIAKPNNGDAWLLNETKIFQDGTMPNAAPNPADGSESTKKKDSQKQKARTLNPTVNRNKGTASTEGYKKSGLTDAANKEVVANQKTPSIRAKVSWYVTDNTQAAGYRRVFGLLEDPATTAVGRDDDNQVRK